MRATCNADARSLMLCQHARWPCIAVVEKPNRHTHGRQKPWDQ